jgi:serine/threonine protein kinase, bacterial
MSALLNNRYRISQTLGQGGCGQTFLAEDTHMPSNRPCVVKQLKPQTNDPAAYQIIRQRFQREAALLETLGRSNDRIPTLYAYFSEGEEFYLVQEWIDGKNLMQKVKEEGTGNDSQVRSLLISLLHVLDYIHSQGVIHRDIKPENIMLRAHDGKPVLIDFGAVKEIVATVIDSYGTPTSSIVIGSPGFMPLEQATGKPVFASDLYSLGLTAIYLLTGKRPQELTDLVTGEISWRQYAPNTSPELAAVLDQATRPLAQQRYRTARQMLEALQSTADPSQLTTLAAEAPSPATLPAMPPPAIVEISPQQPGHKSSRVWLIVIVAVGLIAGTVLIISLANRKDSGGSQGDDQRNQVTAAITSKNANAGSLTPTPASGPVSSSPMPKNESATKNQNISNHSETDINGQLPVPKIYGLSYDAARKVLIRRGWLPVKQSWLHGNSEEVQSGNGPIFWKRGYWELDSCSGTGSGFCLFQFVDPGQRVLVVVTEGEEDEAGQYHAKVSRVFFKSK